MIRDLRQAKAISLKLLAVGSVFLGVVHARAQNTFPTEGNAGIGTTSPASPLTVVSQQSSPNYILGAFLNPSLPHGGLIQLQFGQSQVPYGDGTLIYRYNALTPALSTVSLGTFGHSFGLNVDGAGNVGIGTESPGADLAALSTPPNPSTPVLEVVGNIALAQGTGGQMYFQDGSVQATAWNGILFGGDYAESVDVSGDRKQYEPGDILVIDPVVEGKFVKSSSPYSTGVTGIYSTKPGVVGRRQLSAKTRMKEEVPMAMTGIVPTKVSAENGAIKPGDLLVTSTKSGYAMKGTDHTRMLGAIIGKAIGRLDTGTGVIEAVVTLQ